MQQIIDFLRDVDLNNTREWFADNKPRYQAVQAQWNAFCEDLIRAIGTYDPDVARLTVKDCTYRFYRDTRFSADKRPYKTHFGCFMSPGGKKSMHSGYYFHVGTGLGNGYPAQHMLATGNYCYDPKSVKILREDISMGWDEFRDDILAAADPRFQIDMDYALKRTPREYSPDAPYAQWMRLKSYCLAMHVDDNFITSPNLAQRVADIFHTTKPFNDYINRAVDFAKEEE